MTVPDSSIIPNVVSVMHSPNSADQPVSLLQPQPPLTCLKSPDRFLFLFS